MKTKKNFNGMSRILGIVMMLLLLNVFLGCSKEDDGSIVDSIYSGSGSFNFTGDYNQTFSGDVESTKISTSNGIESLPFSFIDNQGEELFIGLRSDKIEAKTYNMKEIDSEGYAAFQFSTGLYDTGAIGGKGTVKINKINNSQISGSVDMRLARPLNTADTVIVKGSFQLKSQ